MRRVLLATTNAGKLREIRDILGDSGIELVSLDDLAAVPAPEETGATFADNARLKALHYAAHTTLLTIAEDSGLVIDALDGEPGVRSARFLRDGATYPERFAEILRRLGTRASGARSARFICAAAVARGTQVLFETVGAIEGEIATQPRGTGGFGYDPLFYYPPYGRTLAEVSQREKLLVAHRGRAFRAIRDWLTTQREDR